MARWYVKYLDHDWNEILDYDPIDPVVVLNHKDPSTLTCEMGLGQLAQTRTDKAKRDIIDGKLTCFELWRGTTRILDGELRTVNLNNERDTIACEHADYLQYLEERIYPFHYPFTFGDWPKIWKSQDLTKITEDILQAMMDEDTHCPPYLFNNSSTGVSTNYQIDAGDGTTILEHIKVLADRDDGFDYRARVTDDRSGVRFSILHPKNDDGNVVYTITKDIGQITDLDFTRKGPDATWLLGRAASTAGKNTAYEVLSATARDAYWRRDAVVDFEHVRNQSQLQKVTTAEAKKQRRIQRDVSFTVLVNTDYLPNFWSAAMGRPYNLLGRRIKLDDIFFHPFHTITEDFKILDMTITLDSDGNEFVGFGVTLEDE